MNTIFKEAAAAAIAKRLEDPRLLSPDFGQELPRLCPRAGMAALLEHALGEIEKEGKLLHDKVEETAPFFHASRLVEDDQRDILLSHCDSYIDISGRADFDFSNPVFNHDRSYFTSVETEWAYRAVAQRPDLYIGNALLLGAIRYYGRLFSQPFGHDGFFDGIEGKTIIQIGKHFVNMQGAAGAKPDARYLPVAATLLHHKAKHPSVDGVLSADVMKDALQWLLKVGGYTSEKGTCPADGYATMLFQIPLFADKKPALFAFAEKAAGMIARHGDWNYYAGCITSQCERAAEHVQWSPRFVKKNSAMREPGPPSFPPAFG